MKDRKGRSPSPKTGLRDEGKEGVGASGQRARSALLTSSHDSSLVPLSPTPHRSSRPFSFGVPSPSSLPSSTRFPYFPSSLPFSSLLVALLSSGSLDSSFALILRPGSQPFL